ncbi:MAG: DUF2917 domain-containing protein [Nitrospirae bacterium]|nr:DUF2917 domain-containing protein [Nitrospirota bacterium]
MASKLIIFIMRIVHYMVKYFGQIIRTEALIPEESADIRLQDGAIIRIEGNCNGIRISCNTGIIWVTQENDYEDYFLREGEDFVINRHGLVIITALTDTNLKMRLQR